ncbi:MAG: hypothetical protein GY855_01715 [candidate division Zixibacteria bacterium]|nr:hypothetical protein [candidate division Zixibacteria bacterium]
MNLDCNKFKSARILLAVIVIIIMILPQNTEASDDWFGKDKLKHFGLSAFYTIFTYKVAENHFKYSQQESQKFAIGFTFTLGLSKELYDSKHPKETASLKDLIADILGITAGIYIATR